MTKSVFLNLLKKKLVSAAKWDQLSSRRQKSKGEKKVAFPDKGAQHSYYIPLPGNKWPFYQSVIAAMNSPDPMGRINQNRNEGPDTVSTDMDKKRVLMLREIARLDRQPGRGITQT